MKEQTTGLTEAYIALLKIIKTYKVAAVFLQANLYLCLFSLNKIFFHFNL